MRKWETDPRQACCSAPVGKELTCWGHRGRKQSSVSFGYVCVAAIMLPWRDCSARLDTGVVEGGAGWIIQYIFSETIQSMWTEISTSLSVGLYCIGLCISIRFLLLFLSVCCFHRGWHIYLYRPSVLLFNTIAGLIDFSTARCAQRVRLQLCDMTWAQVLSLRSIAARRDALNIQQPCWISLWCLAGFIFLEWSVRCLLFTESVSVFFF